MRIHHVFFLIPVITLCASQAQENPCHCKDKQAPHRWRFEEKHETNFSRYPEVKDTITCRDIIAWQERFRKIKKIISPHSSQQPRVKGTPEDSLYTLRGYMYFVRHESQENGDCDFHIEIGTQNKSDMRAVIEVTNDSCSVQKKILDYVVSKGYSLNKEFSAGVPCVVSGLGFYDGHQKKSKHGRPGITTMSLWELHPVISIQFK